MFAVAVVARAPVAKNNKHIPTILAKREQHAIVSGHKSNVQRSEYRYTVLGRRKTPDAAANTVTAHKNIRVKENREKKKRQTRRQGRGYRHTQARNRPREGSWTTLRFMCLDALRTQAHPAARSRIASRLGLARVLLRRLLRLRGALGLRLGILAAVRVLWRVAPLRGDLRAGGRVSGYTRGFGERDTTRRARVARAREGGYARLSSRPCWKRRDSPRGTA